ncbi:hypothetical protein PLEOSDRAFT_154206 [Pleurotus ostreatus PC15]|uniref:Uncharacterized protein n=1 Tax=Pleurotus ostreatus (strain PC15) TaxID=1137138 RepID=A0A067NVA1_PLEO1|nr:hypothetical protein PLEOSDRAFT_154206 [Pleurotus ostreatus PC15]
MDAEIPRVSDTQLVHSTRDRCSYSMLTVELVQKLKNARITFASSIDSSEGLRLDVCNSLPTPFPRRYMQSSCWLFLASTSELSVKHNTQIRHPTTTIAPPLRCG